MTRPKKNSRQEQEPASTEVVEAAPNVLRLQLPANVPGVGHVNCYALCGGDGVTLVDTGLPGKASWSALLSRLRTAAIPLKRVHTVVLTHSHLDHYGGCAQLLEETGADLLTHKDFTVSHTDNFSREDFDRVAAINSADLKREMVNSGRPGEDSQREQMSKTGSDLHDLLTDDVTDDDDIIDFEDLATNDAEVVPARARHRKLYGSAAIETIQPRATPWGPSHHLHPREALKLLIRAGKGKKTALLPSKSITPKPNVRIDDEDVLQLAGREWIAMHTPGHTMDHICLWDASEGVLLAGDHVLPTITPHIAGSADAHDPLASFLKSLRRIGSLESATVCLPGHGHPFTGLSERARAISRHHTEQLDVLLESARELPDAPVEAFMQVLFKPRSWGYLAASETFAHLEHLRCLGKATARKDHAGLWRYDIKTS